MILVKLKLKYRVKPIVKKTRYTPRSGSRGKAAKARWRRAAGGSWWSVRVKRREW